MDGVIQKSDGSAEYAAQDFRSNQAKRSDHGPAKHSGPQRSVRVAMMFVAVMFVSTMIVTRMIVRMVHVAIMVAVLFILRMLVHSLHFTRLRGASLSPLPLSGKFDTSPA